MRRVNLNEKVHPLRVGELGCTNGAVIKTQSARRSAGRSIAARWVGTVILAALGIGLPAHWVHDSAAAQETAPAGFRMVATANQDAVLLPSERASARLQSGTATIFARSYETAEHRIHELTLHGRTYRAATPLTGPASRIAFDVPRRRFVRLLPSIRVECESREQAESFARLVGADKTRYLDRLGFAILILPDTVHPAEAADRVNAEAEGEPASVRLRRRNPQWK